MRKGSALLALLLLAARPVFCVEFDLTADGMRDIDDTTKSLNSNLATKNSKNALGEAQEIAAFFLQVQGYYEAKGNAQDAVDYARKSHELAGQIAKSVAANDLDAAAATVSSLTRICKSCHNAYKTD
ncbi:MAG: hypothetical protein JOY60_13005 [Burkholderiaceae bacterium]|nr:hypothetical protein [Roseateles sp.]MBV8470764.1 hypothetical protein [Burkholderiaceae bacterium]